MKPGWLENSKRVTGATSEVPTMLRKIALWNVSFSPSVRLRRTQSRLIRIGLLCAMFSFPFNVWGQAIAPSSESQAKPAASMQIDYGMPERLGRQVAPTPSAPWSAPDLRGYTSLLKSAEPSPIDAAETL